MRYYIYCGYDRFALHVPLLSGFWYEHEEKYDVKYTTKNVPISSRESIC